MKFLTGFLVLISLSAFSADDNIDYDALSKRFVTSVKDAQVDSRFLQEPEIQQCITDFPIPSDLKNQAAIRDAQQKAADCVRRKLSSDVDPSRLNKLSSDLQLEAFGVVKDKSNAEIVNYLSGRLEKALYGKENGKVKRLGDQNIVDQKVFVDIYETQLGKNILLEVSNYCYNRLDFATTTPNRLDELSKFADGGSPPNPIKNAVYANQLTDVSDISGSKVAATPTDNIYEGITREIPQALVNSGTLNRLFINCATAIQNMCQLYEYCSCRYRKAKGTEPSATACTPPVTPAPSCPTVPATEPTVGQHSCHVTARLRGYRTNLAALVKTKEQFRMDDVEMKYKPKDLYRREDADDNESIDALTSFTTKDATEALKNDGIANDAGGITKDCIDNPENVECAKFFYKDTEVQKFANSSVVYNAATLVESEKINKLDGNKKDLADYLRSRSYFDLAEEVDTGGNMSEIVAKARRRFETERDSTFKEMTSAFERKQFSTELAGEDAKKREDRLNEVKQEYLNRGKEFQQLILFNNVVSSYLDLTRINADGSQEKLGSNVKAFQREAQNTQEPGSEVLIEHFSNINSESSTLQNTDTPVVDINFLDAILGNSEAKARAQQSNNVR